MYQCAIKSPNESRNKQRPHHRPSNMSSNKAASTESQSTFPQLWYTLSYAAMLACEKKWMRSRMLSICRTDCSMRRRLGRLSTKGVAVGGWSAALVSYKDKEWWWECYPAGLDYVDKYLCCREIPDGLRQSVKESYRWPLIGTVYCVNSIGNEHPLVSRELICHMAKESDPLKNLHLELFCL